ncbi:MAG: ribosome maturation factor RimP [Candidatus Spyradocola sp.]|nr:ribosome maturation factor RimP [Candidatus Spyradocola sp.]
MCSAFNPAADFVRKMRKPARRFHDFYLYLGQNGGILKEDRGEGESGRHFPALYYCAKDLHDSIGGTTLAKKSVTATAGQIAERLAQKMGYEFVDVELAKEHGAAFLRIFVDKEGGMSLDDCSAFHHAIMGELEDLEYDYLEISSPGVDRPLKRDKDFEKAKGETVEVKLYRAIDGVKLIQGQLLGLEGDQVVLMTEAGEKRFARKDCAYVKPVIEYEDIEEE